MAKGRIKNYTADRRYGFIAPEGGGQDLFFHLNSCKGFQPAPDQIVDFTVRPGKEGRSAAQDLSLVTGSGQKENTAPKPPQTGTSKSAPGRPIASDHHRSSNQGGGGCGRNEGPVLAGSHDDYLLPKSTAAVVKAVLKTGAVAQRLNPSLLLDRCPQRSHVDHSKIEKGRESEQGQHVHLQHVKDALVKSWPRKEDYQQLLAHLEGGIPPVLNTLQARLALHLSRAGGLENANICLHPVHGIPYIPGSGLKGLAHAYACHLFHAKEEAGRMDKDDAPDPGGETGAWRDDDEREAFIRAVEDIFGWAPNRERSGPATTDWSPCAGRIGGGDADAHDGIAQHRGLVAFHDAFGEDPQTGLPPRLELDVCTPHYGAYYRGESPPGDWLSPVPVTFLTIAAGSRFRFRVGKADPVVCSEELFNAAKRLLLGGLHWLGAGAKTAAGYGWFSDDWQEDPALEERKRQQEEATRRNALLERYRGLEPDQVLFLPDQANDRSRSGRIIGPGEAGATWRSLAKAKFKDNFKKNNWKKGQMLIARRSPEGHLEGPVEVLDLPIPPLESA